MSAASALAAVLVVSLVTYVSRAGLILTLADRTLPEPIQRALRNVAPAVLTALVVTLVAGGDGVSGIEAGEIAGLAAGSVAAAISRNLVAALAAGMVVLWLVEALA